MTLLLLGAGGQVGQELRRSLAPLGKMVALKRQDCDLSDPARLAATIRDIAPDVIVNAAAYTAVDRAEDEEELATIINARAPAIIAEEARRLDALLIHYSTDYVFSGDKDAPYTEDDPTNPINAYGRSKSAGEIAIEQAGCAHLILRTSWVYAAHGHNFLRTILRLSQERDELRIVADQIGAPTWARHIAEATAQAIEQSVRERQIRSFASGIFHLTASDATSWHGFAQAILDHAGSQGPEGWQKPRLVPVTTQDYPTKAARPRNSRLCNRRIAERFSIHLPDWTEGMRLCLQEISEQKA